MRPILLVGWCALIWFFSDQPDLRVADDDVLDLVLRKAAHLVVFAVLAVLATTTLRQEGVPAARSLAAAWVVALGWAVLDEWHQTFVPGRAGQLTDVAIDAAGAAIAVAAIHWRDRHRSEEHAP